ncbi:MlaD family protein [Nocardia miyunensis]|uniref:MlaD family protein n=1 Tax=Nocardia miyunensis TaxID=282684 RepID=UPI00082B50B2|nr:MlaD family protein [Nocardia miyunensis]
MLAKIFGSRGLMSAAVVVVVALVAATGLKLSKPSPDMRTYCAEMPDSIGLYRDSAVTIMGLQVGRVTDIEPDGATARVSFTVPASRKLPPDVGAVTVSNTLIADRNLALIGAEPTGPGWDPNRCITKTLTPKSLSQTFDALTKLAGQLESAPDLVQRNTFGTGIDALDHATAGTGAQLNAVITQLSRALAAPDAAIGHIGRLLDALAELTRRTRDHWPDVRTTMTELTQTLTDINAITLAPIVEIVDNLKDTVPQIDDVITMFASPGLHALDSIPDLPRLIAAGVGSLTDILRMAPAIATGFAATVDRTSGKFTIGYAPPKIALPQQDTGRICAAVQTITGRGCQSSGNGAVEIPALPLLLAGVSAK